MRVIKSELRRCPCCWQTHEVKLVQEEDLTIFKGDEVRYDKVFEYCELSDYTNEPVELMNLNDLAVKDAYRQKVGLMTSKDIKALRKKYGISQVDLCILLGYGQRTITRYESYQVQTVSHDLMLRKLWEDVDWFLDLLEQHKELPSYERYKAKAKELQEEQIDSNVERFIGEVGTSYPEIMRVNPEKLTELLKKFNRFMLRSDDK